MFLFEPPFFLCTSKYSANLFVFADYLLKIWKTLFSLGNIFKNVAWIKKSKLFKWCLHDWLILFWVKWLKTNFILLSDKYAQCSQELYNRTPFLVPSLLSLFCKFMLIFIFMLQLFCLFYLSLFQYIPREQSSFMKVNISCKIFF